MKHFFLTVLIAQTTIDGPGMQWFSEQWYDDGNTVTQDNSGEDWYYDFKMYDEDADDIADGFIGAGFSGIVNETRPYAECSDCEEDDVNCLLFETEGHQLGCNHPKLAELNLKGETEWYHLYGPENSGGYFRSVVQFDDGYVSVGKIGMEGGGELIYNYQDGETGDALDQCPEGKLYNLLYLAQTNNDGDLILERTYGWADPSEVSDFSSEAYEIIRDADGSGYAIIGYTDVDIERIDDDGYLTRAWVIKIDEDFEIEWQRTYELSVPEPVTPIPWSEGYCIIEIGDYYYLGCIQVPEHDFDNSYIHIVQIRKADGTGYDAGDAVKDFVIDTDIDPDILTPLDGESVSHNRPFQLIENNGNLLVASGTRRSTWWGDTEVRDLAKVYRIDIDATPDWTVNIIDVTEGQTFDLKTGITNTNDGGYAVTTTVHAGDLIDEGDHPYEKDYAPGETCIFDYDDHADLVNTHYWNADAYVAKFDGSDIMEWEQTYPLTDQLYDDDVMFPDDIKRMECVYKILQTPDDGYVVAGNDSKNFDDDLVIKIYDDCNRYVQYYTGTGDINVNGITTLGDETWDSDKKVRGIVEIPDDVTLTIKDDAVIQFADSKADNIPTYIVVRRGGRLIIEDGAKLTGNMECGTMWDGIYVEGTFGTNQPSVTSLLTNSYYVVGDAHGIVKITGDATIENARCGITLGMSPLNDEYPDYDGGIVIADGANFLNNTIDIFFWPFDKSEVSFIRNSNFITNAALVDNYEVPEAHIEMLQVKNVTLRGNHFENSTDNSVYSGTDRGIGILSFNGTYIANDNPNGFGATGGTGTDPNYFTDMYYGIYAAQYTSLSSNIVIDGNVIEDNGRGIYLGGTSLAEVNRNTFTMPEKSNYALYLDASTGYGVEENIFTGSGADHPQSQAGVVINESGTASNLLYRNAFNDLKYAARVQGNNGNTSNGLELKCNTFEDNMFDISVVSGSTTATMKKDQGACGTSTSPANNLFTDPSFADLNTQIKTSSDITTANYYKYTFHEDDDPAHSPFAAPAYYSNPIDPKPDGDADETGCDDVEPYNPENRDTYCPSNFTSGGGSGRMANPGRVKPKNGLFLGLTYNPYEYLKTDGEEYEEFLDQISFNMLASYYMQSNYNDSLFNLLQNGTSVLAQSILAQIAVDSSNYSEADEIAAEMEEDSLADDEGFSLLLQNISTDLAKDTLTWLDLNDEQSADIHEIAMQDNREGIQAKLLLELIDGTNYEERINPLDEEVTEEEVRQIQSIYPPSELNSINIYPQPVSNGSIVEVHLDRVEANTRFIITDLQGRYIMQFPVDEPVTYIKLNNTILKAGIYTGYITCNGCDRLSKQIVVIK